MKILQVINETWQFQCLACNNTWQEAYEAWHTDDGHGGDAVAWRLNGMTAMPPWADPSCPSCLGLRVKPLPLNNKPHSRLIDHIAAVPPIALAFISSPDRLDTAQTETQITAVDSTDDRDQRVDDADPQQHWSADRGTPGHYQLPGLAASSQNHVPAPARDIGAEPAPAPTIPIAADGHSWRHLNAPETLQIFRC